MEPPARGIPRARPPRGLPGRLGSGPALGPAGAALEDSGRVAVRGPMLKFADVRLRWRSARRGRRCPLAAHAVARQKSPQRTAPAAATTSGGRAGRTPPLVQQRRARAGCGAPVRRREAQGSWPRAQRASSSDSSRLFERSDRRERSEFRDGATRPSIGGQSVRSTDRRAEALRTARARLCRASPAPSADNRVPFMNALGDPLTLPAGSPAATLLLAAMLLASLVGLYLRALVHRAQPVPPALAGAAPRVRHAGHQRLHPRRPAAPALQRLHLLGLRLPARAAPWARRGSSPCTPSGCWSATRAPTSSTAATRPTNAWVRPARSWRCCSPPSCISRRRPSTPSRFRSRFRRRCSPWPTSATATTPRGRRVGRINHDAHLGGAVAGLLFVAVTDTPALLRAWHTVLP